MSLGNTTKFEGEVKPSSIEQASFEPDLWANRITEIPSNMQMRVAYNADGTVLYTGYAPKGLTSSSTGWLLQKFTYDASQRVTLRQIAYDSWDNRASATFA